MGACHPPLGELPNVVVQALRARHRGRLVGWTVDDLAAPFVDSRLEAFGPDRLLFGSDWPVCLLAATYDGSSSAATS